MSPYAYTLDRKCFFFLQVVSRKSDLCICSPKADFSRLFKKLSFYYKYLEGVELFSTMIGEMFIQELIVPVLVHQWCAVIQAFGSYYFLPL